MIIIYNHGLIGDPTKAKVEIDQRMLDFCVGLDTEFSEAVEGSHLYFPKTKFEQVNILAEVCESGFYLGFKIWGRSRRRQCSWRGVYGRGMCPLLHEV